MAEVRAHNARTGVMLDEKLAVFTGKRLAQHHGDEAVANRTGSPRPGLQLG